MSFNPVRLAIARERRGLSGKELADACEVTAQTVYNWEAGIMVPRPEALKRVALLLRFPESFFSRPDWDRLVEGAASFRARTKIRPKDKRSALAAGDLACELVEWIEAR